MWTWCVGKLEKEKRMEVVDKLSGLFYACYELGWSGTS